MVQRGDRGKDNDDDDNDDGDDDDGDDDVILVEIEQHSTSITEDVKPAPDDDQVINM